MPPHGFAAKQSAVPDGVFADEHGIERLRRHAAVGTGDRARGVVCAAGRCVFRLPGRGRPGGRGHAPQPRGRCRRRDPGPGAAEDALPGQAYYGLLDLAALPAQTDWQTAQQIGTLLYDVAQPAPELSVFALAEADNPDWEEEAPALYEAMKAAESAYEVHCGLQQLFAQSEVCAVPALAQSGYDLLLLPRGGAPLRCRGLAGAQLAAVLCGQAQRLQGTFAGGQAACEADAHVTVEGQTVQLHLRACALQALTGQAPDDLESALQRELQASFAALYGQTHRAGADPFHLDFWQACTYGPRHTMQDPQLTVLFE